MLKSNYKIKKLKEIANEIVEEEKLNNNIDTNLYPVTFIEYYNQYVLKKTINLVKKASLSLYALYARGFYDMEGNIVIFLNTSDRIISLDGNLFSFVKTCYHEFRHTVQNEFSDESYEKFLTVVEALIRQNNNNVSYLLLHDDFSYEIGANLYGIRKAKEYVKRRYPYIYDKEKEKINILENKYTFEYLTYDAAYNFDKFYKIIKSLSFINISDLVKFLEKYKIFQIFLNNDGSFKTIKDIINNVNTFKIDSRIVSAVISSRSFIETVSVQSLSKEELEFFYKHLNYTNYVYNNQLETMTKYKNQKGIDLSNYLKKRQNIVDKARFMKNYIKKCVIKNLYLSLTKYKRKNHKKIINKYIEKTQEEISKKR